MVGYTIEHHQTVLDYGFLYIKVNHQLFMEQWYGEIAAPRVDVLMVSKRNLW
jgi:hypothetical protein